MGTDHTELILKPKVEDTFEAVATMFDEPLADPSAIPNFLVAQLARQKVTVALSGDGGDELFGGYTRYRKTLSHAGGSPGILQRMLASAALLLPHFTPARNRLINYGRSDWGRYSATVVEPVRIGEGGVARADQPGGAAMIADQLQDRACGELEDDLAAAMMLADVETYLPGDILTKVDRTSMAVSLEARVPLLDFDLVDFSLRIPGKYRVTPGESKRLFRRAVKGIIPDSVLTRPKQGFEIPLGRWFRGPLRHHIEALREPSAELRQFVEVSAVRRLVSEHVIGRRDHSNMLWRLMVLERWLERFSGGSYGSMPAVPDLAAG